MIPSRWLIRLARFVLSILLAFFVAVFFFPSAIEYALNKIKSVVIKEEVSVKEDHYNNPLKEAYRWEVYEYRFEQPIIVACRRNRSLWLDEYYFGLFLAKAKLLAVLNGASSATREVAGTLILDINSPIEVESMLTGVRYIPTPRSGSPSSPDFSALYNLVESIVKTYLLPTRQNYIKQRAFSEGKEQLENLLSLHRNGKRVIVNFGDSSTAFEPTSPLSVLPMVLALDIHEGIFQSSGWRRIMDKTWEEIKGSYSIDEVGKVCFSAYDLLEKDGKKFIMSIKTVISKEGVKIFELPEPIEFSRF